MSALLALLLSSPATAQDCDATALRAAYRDATPVAVARTWTALARCDEGAARRELRGALSKMLAGDDANEAVVLAAGMGADDALRGWLQAQEPSQQSKTIAHLGSVCGDDAEVRSFLLDSADALGDAFWEDRWYRGLADCRTPEVQELLGGAVSARAEASGAERGQFLGVLEAYAGNLRGEAVSTLVELAGTLSSEDELVYVVSAFGDAAAVGAPEGPDPDTAAEAARAIVDLGPDLPSRAVEQARTILLALGDQDASDRMARHRWRDRMRDGAYDYAVAVTEDVTCKNGKTQKWLHTATLREPGELWPDQLEDALRADLPTRWSLDAARKCKGTGELVFALPDAPFADEAARDAWLSDRVEAFEATAADAHKSGVEAHEGLSL